MTDAPAAVVDVAFELRGNLVPGDHGYALFRALAGRLDWLEAEPVAGVHPIRGTRCNSGEILLGHRAKLVLRLAAARVGAALRLEGGHLDVGSGLVVGPGRIRGLMPYATVHSHFVSTGAAAESDFLDQIAAELGSIGIPCPMICGKAHVMHTPEREVRGFSLLLHGLSLAQSLAVQEAGLGQARKFGCGIFVPHKSVLAVAA